MTDLELLELLVQNRDRLARELLKCIRMDARIASNMWDIWRNQAGGND